MSNLFRPGTQAKSPSGNVYIYARAAVALKHGQPVVFAREGDFTVVRDWRGWEVDQFMNGMVINDIKKDACGWILVGGDRKKEFQAQPVPIPTQKPAIFRGG